MSRMNRTSGQRVISGMRVHRSDPRLAARREDGGRTPESVRLIYRTLGTRGLRPSEAGNLTAYVHGLAPVEQGWRPAEIERLLFVRYLVEHGRMGS